MRTIQPKILEILGARNSREPIFENLVIPHEVVLFSKIPKNAVPFEKCLEIQTGIFGVVESALHQTAFIQPTPL